MMKIKSTDILNAIENVSKKATVDKMADFGEQLKANASEKINEIKNIDLAEKIAKNEIIQKEKTNLDNLVDKAKSALSNYNTKAITKQDANEIIAIMKEIGLQSQLEISKVLSQIGYDGDKLQSLVNSQAVSDNFVINASNMPAQATPPPPMRDEIISKEETTIDKFMQTLKEMEQKRPFSVMNDNSDQKSQKFLSTGAFKEIYTALKTEARSQIMDEIHSLSSSNYSASEQSRLFENKVNSVLQNPQNINVKTFIA